LNYAVVIILHFIFHILNKIIKKCAKCVKIEIFFYKILKV
jgi:hypothetical protein